MNQHNEKPGNTPVNPDQELQNTITDISREPVDANGIEQASLRVWSRLSEEMQATGSAAEVGRINGCEEFSALLPAYRDASLTPARALLMQDHLRECIFCRKKNQEFVHAGSRVVSFAENQLKPWKLGSPAGTVASWSRMQYAKAAAVFMVVGLSTIAIYSMFFAVPVGARATVQSVEGSLYRVAADGVHVMRAGEQVGEGEVIRTTAGSHAFVQLFDGSVVEMNERAELSVSRRPNSTTVNLGRGNIIVQASKRRTGHLYVESKECSVAVTGTVFSVNSATKGSRVAVMEGEVHVTQSGTESILHSGDEFASNTSIGTIPIEDEIAWSRNRTQHLALLAEFSKLAKKFNTIPSPNLRYSSAILPLLPANTIVYASTPNYGEALNQAKQIFDEQLKNSPVLQQWWESSQAGNSSSKLADMVDRMHELSRYVGNEIVFTASSDAAGGKGSPMLVAAITRPGIRELLQADIDSLVTNPDKRSHIRLFDPESLAAAAFTGNERHDLLVLIRPDYVVFSPDFDALVRINRQFNIGASGFAGTDFGRRISSSFSHGVGLLLAADLGSMKNHVMANVSARTGQSRRVERAEHHLQNTGFEDIDYLVIERTEVAGQAENQAELAFHGARHGIASWLAAPAPMGSLDFISENASLSVSFITKNPALMFDDLQQIIASSGGNGQKHLDEAESKLGLRLRDDLAATLGGDVSIALDGPVLPTPSWKIVAEVNDPTRLQNSLQTLVQDANHEATEKDCPEVHLEQEQVDSQVYFVVRHADEKGIAHELHYTFSDGYIIVAPTRAALMNTLHTHTQGTTLARSASFQSLLPSDPQANFSAVVYQNVAPVLQSLSGVVDSQQLQALQSLSADSKPSAVCAYGDADRIRVASRGDFFGLNLNTLAFSALMRGQRRGTLGGKNPYHQQP